MTAQIVHYFWVAVSALFIASAAYAWFVAIIVRKTLPGELVWVYAQLAMVAASFAFMWSGEKVVPIQTIWIVAGIFFFSSAISAIASVVELGNQYNGEISSRIPLTQQWRMLRKGIHQQEGRQQNESEK